MLIVGAFLVVTPAAQELHIIEGVSASGGDGDYVIEFPIGVE